MVTPSNLDLFLHIEKYPPHERSDKLLTHLQEQLRLPDTLASDAYGALKKFCTTTCSKIHTKWRKCKRSRPLFLKRHDSWLKSFPNIPRPKKMKVRPTIGKGRPKLSFHRLCQRSKRMRTQKARQSYSSSELLHAAQMKCKEEGNSSIAKILNNICKTPSLAKDVLKKMETKSPTVSLTDALNLLVEADLSKLKYILIRDVTGNILPPYSQLLLAKQDCYPDKEELILSETRAEVTLQGLVDQTCRRLFKMIDLGQNLTQLQVLFKWGFDGSGNHSRYNQAFQVDDSSDDGNIFFTCCVPLQLFGYKGDEERLILWSNPKPGSSRFCRPIKIIFEKESKELVQNIQEDVLSQISTIRPTVCVDKSGVQAICTHQFIQTMVDGKICSILTEKGCQRCYICNALPSEMNIRSKFGSKVTNVEALKFGIAPLHFKLRALSCILNISYRQDIKEYRVQGEELQTVVQARKLIVQSALWSKMSIRVDVVRPGGGTTNTGNVARKFFSKPSLASECTGVIEQLIRRLAVIGLAISCNRQVDPVLFGQYASATFDMYLENYSWYLCPPTLHKVLIHGEAIMKLFAFTPLGSTTEEASESRHKDLRKYRLSFTRKCDRKKSNEDLLKRLLLSSDPIVSSSNAKLLNKNNDYVAKEVLEELEGLLIPQQKEAQVEIDVPECAEISSEESDDE